MTIVLGLNAPAIAASTSTVKVGNLITVSYPKSVKLKSSGCQNIKVTYRIGKMSGFDYAYVGFLDDADNLIGGDIVYETPDFATSQGRKISKKTGSVNIKICRSDWSEDIGDGDYEDYVGASKGEFQVYVSTSDFDNVSYIKFN